MSYRASHIRSGFSGYKLVDTPGSASKFLRNQASYAPPAADAASSGMTSADYQQLLLNIKSDILDNARPTVRPDLIPLTGIMPGDAHPLVQAAAVAYPAPAAAAATVLSYTPTPGTVLVITQLGINHIGGNPPDFTGGVVWRLSIDGAWVKGLDNMQYQTGTQSAPSALAAPLIVFENCAFLVTVEVPNGQAPQPGGVSTACRIAGFVYPLVKAYSR